MTDHIDFELKSDHDLLVITAQTCNNISEKLDGINGIIRDHEQRIITLEANDPVAPNKNTSRVKQAGLVGGLFAAGSLIGGAFYAFGQAMAWW